MQQLDDLVAVSGADVAADYESSTCPVANGPFRWRRFVVDASVPEAEFFASVREGVALQGWDTNQGRDAIPRSETYVDVVRPVGSGRGEWRVEVARSVISRNIEVFVSLSNGAC